jgi:hypothetical protein
VRALLISLSALAVVSIAGPASAESRTAVLNVTALVAPHCAIDTRSAAGELDAPLDLRCLGPLPPRVDVGPVQTLTAGQQTHRVVVTTVNF